MFSDASYLALNSPLDHPVHFTGLELLIVVSFALTLRHALVHYRRGDRYHLLQWLVAVAYGIVIELIAYNYINSYDHGQFTIQLYHRKLPLYVVFLYPVFHYTGLKLVERWRLSVIPEALIAGLAMCMIDIPFDVAGVNARWWVWLSGDPNFTVRWLGVPLTSYYWYLVFGAIYAALCRVLRKRLERRSLTVYILLSPLLAAAIIALGTIGFLPFHGLVALGVPTEIIVLGQALLCCALAIYLRPRQLAPSVPSLAAIPVALAVWNLGVLALLAWRGQVSHPAASIGIALAASLGVAALVWPPLRKAAAVPTDVTKVVAESR